MRRPLLSLALVLVVAPGVLAVALTPRTARSAPAPAPASGDAAAPRPDASAPALRGATSGRLASSTVPARPPPRPRWLVPTLHAGGLLLVLRAGASLAWPQTYDLTRVSRNAHTFARSWSSPPDLDTRRGFFEWDGDPWPINLVGHGLMGSELYLRYREAHHPWWAAGLMTLAFTFVWEYLIEAWHKQPSGIDLLWTPTGGALLGEGRYQLYRLARRRLRPSAGRHVLLYLLDPLGQLERDVLGLAY